MEGGSPDSVLSAFERGHDDASADPCITCKNLLDLAQRIIAKNLQRRDHEIEPVRDRSWLLQPPLANIGRLVDILADSSCEKHKGFVRNTFLMQDNVDATAHPLKDDAIKAYWRADRDRAELVSESCKSYFFREILLLTCEPSICLLPCMGRQRDEDFIDINLAKNWISSCERNHTKSCGIQTLPSTQLSWMIDTKNPCLVPAEDGARYVALSYVWGHTEILKSTRDTIRILQEAGSLGAKTGFRVPKIVRDAIALVPRLGERYLWVDSLCIMQDDRECLDRHIRHMASIYEAAIFTIVAADGSDADYGILGIRGVSAPRKLPSMVELTSQLRLRSRGRLNILVSPWGQRAWTLQEHVFSKRKLVFVHGSVQWICQEHRCFEDIRQEAPSTRMKRRRDYDMDQERESVGDLVLRYPVVSQLDELLHGYTARKLTFGNDALRAIEAVFMAHRLAFPSGFLLGLPLDFFDLALLWYHTPLPVQSATRRPAIPPSKASPFPSWTWAGWVGTLKLGSWRAATYIKEADENWYWGKRCLTIPMLEWRYQSDNKTSGLPVPGQNSANAYRRKFMGKASGLPNGWKYENESLGPMSRDAWLSFNTLKSNDWGLQTPYYYSHEAAPGVKFWHPVPISPDPPSDTTVFIDGRLLCAETQRGRLWVIGAKGNIPVVEDLTCPGETVRIHLFSDIIPVETVLLDEKGELVGDLHINDRDDYEIVTNYKSQPDETGYPCELVAISRGNDFVHPMEPGKEEYTFYNVLWVKWEDGIAYRRGVGSVKRETWESMELEDVDLILG